MIEVAIWLPTAVNVGHASAQIGFGQSHETYVSWWPGSGTVLKFAPGATNSRSEDERAEGRTPNELVQIDGLDEFAASSFVKIVAISSIVRLRSLGTASTAMEPAAI